MPNLTKLTKKIKAFSLIELMVVIAIIGIMSGIAVVSLTSSKNMTQLNAAERELASAIKQAQSYALQGKVVGNVVPCGFGIYFNSSDATKYEIFYPKNEVSCTNFNNDSSEMESADKTSLESYSLQGGIKFDDDTKGKKIYFTAPHANIFDEDGNEFNGHTVVLKNTDDKTKTIEIGRGGNVEEE